MKNEEETEIPLKIWKKSIRILLKCNKNTFNDDSKHQAIITKRKKNW